MELEFCECCGNHGLMLRYYGLNHDFFPIGYSFCLCKECYYLLMRVAIIFSKVKQNEF